MVRSVALGQFRVTWALDEPMWAPGDGAFASGSGDEGGVSAAPAVSGGYEGLALGDLDAAESRPASVPTQPEEPTPVMKVEPTEPPSAPGPMPPEAGPADLGTSPPSDMAGTPQRSAKEETDEGEKERKEAPPTPEPSPEAGGPPRPVREPNQPAQAGPPPQGEPEATPLPSAAEPLVVRKAPRGQFHVMSAWHVVPPAASAPAVITRPEPPPEQVRPCPPAPSIPAPSEIGPERPPPEPELAGAPSVPVAPVLAEAAPSIPVAPVVVESPSPVPEASVIAEPVPPVPVSAPGPGRTLLGLLARMWLMRSSAATSGGLTLERPAPAAPSLEPPPESPPAVTQPPPEPPSEEAVPAPAVPIPPPVVSPEATAPIALPSPLPLPLTEPVPRPTLREPPSELPPDVDDRHPVSGLASLLMEVAASSRMLPTSGPETTSAARTTVVVRLVHCRHPIPDRPVSRDACRQPRVGR